MRSLTPASGTCRDMSTKDGRMDPAGDVINAVLVEGRSVEDVSEAHEISRSWLYE